MWWWPPAPTPACCPGSRPIADRILTNMEILALPQIPKSMVVIGAGAVGVEFGSIFKSFGSEITIVEYLPTGWSPTKMRM